METLNETFEVTELPEERCFVVKWTQVIKNTAEEFVGNFTGIETNVNQAQERLDGLGKRMEEAKKQLETEIKTLSPRIESLGKNFNQAKLWAEINKQENERRKKEEQNESK